MKLPAIFFLLLCTLGVKSQSASPELLNFISFSGLENKTKSGYGSIDDPIPSGAFMNPSDMANLRTQMLKLRNSWRWPDGQPIDFSKRFSTKAKSGDGILDCYSLVKPGSTDTIRLYVDPYHQASAYYVPKGLAAVTLPVLEKEIAPYVKEIEAIEASSDASQLKASSRQVFGYLNQNIGLKGLVDGDALQAVLSDKEAEKELKDLLLEAYVLNKFYAYAKNLPEAKQYAYSKMKANFEEYLVAHPEAKTGTLKTSIK